jgi:hypothetical protein
MIRGGSNASQEAARKGEAEAEAETQAEGKEALLGEGAMVPLTAIRVNDRNPRRISEASAAKLAESIKRDPRFMELRPIIVDEQGVILGGNQRFEALMRLGYTEVPASWVRLASGLTDEERQRFIIIDNSPEGMSGYWDWDTLNQMFDHPQLEDLGFLFPANLDIDETWGGMPEFIQSDKRPYRSIHVHFRNEDDVAEFSRLINQAITERTRAIWHPKLREDEISSETDFVYTTEDEPNGNQDDSV